MVLPSLRVKWIDDHKGYGLFATEPIPMGTVTFIQDKLDIALDSNDLVSLGSKYTGIVDTYSYDDHRGRKVLSWDLGKYMNHCCHANTLTTAFGFEIAVKDIAVGEEVTDDYRLFSTGHDIAASCGKKNCKGHISYSELADELPFLNSKINAALAKFNLVHQPLLRFFNEETLEELKICLGGKRSFPGVERLLEA